MAENVDASKQRAHGSFSPHKMTSLFRPHRSVATCSRDSSVALPPPSRKSNMSTQRQWISTATGASPPRPTVRNVFTSPFRPVTHDRATSPINSAHASEGSVVDQCETHCTRSLLHRVVEEQQRRVPRTVPDGEYLPSPPSSSSSSTSSTSSSSTTNVTPLLGSEISPPAALMSMSTGKN